MGWHRPIGLWPGWNEKGKEEEGSLLLLGELIFTLASGCHLQDSSADLSAPGGPLECQAFGPARILCCPTHRQPFCGDCYKPPL